MRFLTEVHDLLRPNFRLTRETRLVFAVAVDGEEHGAGYDDETGRYLLMSVGELESSDPAPLIAAIAHELRHAYQHEARHGTVDDIRADMWREARKGYDADDGDYEYNALETDAQRAYDAVGSGYTAIP